MTEQLQEQEDLPSLTEVVESLTGFDEIAIEQAFGADIMTLLKTKSTTAARAGLFIRKRRAGMKDGDARKAVMEMTLGDVQSTYNADDDDDDVEPVTEPGKDDVRSD